MTNKDSFYPEEFYTDDRVTARVNSGEAVLTAAQQRNFMALANGERGGSGTQINITSNAGNWGMDKAKSIIKGLLEYIKHSCDDNYSNSIHEAEDFIGGKI